MLFNSLQYLIFLPAVLLLYWMSPLRYRIAILLTASYLFYMSWKPAFILLIAGLTLANYWFGLRIHSSATKKKAWLTASILTNLSTLAFFKYFYLLEDAILLLLHPIFGQLPKLPLNIPLPLGISFFVFEFIHYVVDVYKGQQPVKELAPFALFPSFFPTQIAGPIKRYQDFIPQLYKETRLSSASLDEGIYLILWGLTKKVLLADNLAFFVQGGYQNPSLFNGFDLWIFAYAFTFQLYFDFSGYADIARGSAKLFGFDVPLNFDCPFLASNIADIWRRWHMTLSSWLKDYLFIPLGGTRCSRWKIARNFLITFTICGLWHGAAFHYLVFGFLHGTLLVLHREFVRARDSVSFLVRLFESRAGKCFSIFTTFQTWTLALVIFRADTVEKACLMLKKMVVINPLQVFNSAAYTLSGINYPLIYPTIFWILSACAVGIIAVEITKKRLVFSNFPRGFKVACGVSLLVLLISLAPDRSPRFIYFQF